MDNPTQQQIQEFVEWCGATRLDNDYFTFGDKSERFSLAFWRKPTLDFLFQRAMPKLMDIIQHKRVDPVNSYQYQLFMFLQGWVTRIAYGNEDPPLALFWILYKEMRDDTNS